jgi:hypothetical protein
MRNFMMLLLYGSAIALSSLQDDAIKLGNIAPMRPRDAARLRVRSPRLPWPVETATLRVTHRAWPDA